MEAEEDDDEAADAVELPLTDEEYVFEGGASVVVPEDDKDDEADDDDAFRLRERFGMINDLRSALVEMPMINP